MCFSAYSCVRYKSCQEKRINFKLSGLCLTIKNDRIWLLWNNGGNSFKIQAGFFKISDYHTSGRFKSLAKLMIRYKSSPWGDSDRFFRMHIVTVG